MKAISNKEKAKEIANYFAGEIDNYSAAYAYHAAIAMAKWKDEQFQKVLDYAENCYGVFSFEQRENFINYIKEIFY